MKERIRMFRRQKGLTQTELGIILGVGQRAVSFWESGVSHPSITLLPSLSKALGCRIDDLFEDMSTVSDADDFSSEIDELFGEA